MQFLITMIWSPMEDYRSVVVMDSQAISSIDSRLAYFSPDGAELADRFVLSIRTTLSIRLSQYVHFNRDRLSGYARWTGEDPQRDD